MKFEKFDIWIVVMKIREDRPYEYHCVIAKSAQDAANVVRNQFPDDEILAISKIVKNWK